MKWSRNLRLSGRVLIRSRVRTSLSAGGVAVGVASVVVLMGAGAGAQKALEQAMEPMGRNLLIVRATRTATNPLRGTSRLSTTLTVSDWRAIHGEVPGLLSTAPVVDRPMPARVGGTVTTVRVNGTTRGFARARNLPLVAGRFLDDDDLALKSRVVVVGSRVVENLFGGESPLGETLLLGNVPFRIVGITRKKGVSWDGSDEDELVFVPLTTAMSRLMDVDSLNFIYVQTITEETIPIATTRITRLLRSRHALPAGVPDDFGMQDQKAMVRAQRRLTGSFSSIVTWLVVLALGLGGTGLLAVSLLSVRERHPEIGLRLAVGGRPGDVLLQFLAEAVMISTLGGIAGLGFGAAGILLGESMTRWPMALSWQAVVYPLAISAAIAVVFGTYPALRAARLDPIEALNSR